MPLFYARHPYADIVYSDRVLPIASGVSMRALGYNWTLSETNWLRPGNYTLRMATSETDWIFLSYPLQIC